MTAVADEPATGDELERYREVVAGRPSGIDETVTLDGYRREDTGLVDQIRDLGLDGLLERREETRRFVADDGITYGLGAPIGDDGHGAGPEGAQAWELDPLPLVLDATEWKPLDRGLRQRAALLDGVLADLAGPQRLVRDGVLPGAAVYGHGGWLPQTEGISLPTRRQLVLPATDLARDEVGTWCVFSDRTQAPSGAGYAMANRRIIARVMPTLHRSADLARLRGFFDSVQRALHAVAPQTDDTPRVVILTPGARSETAFDQAFQSTLLGLPLVESEDLLSRDGRIWMRTTSGLAPVDVIVRRVDADWCDQLELRPESRLGLPGMVEAARLGNVSIVNPLSSGVLENPALIPYLPQICRRILGEDLLLPSPSTWWAGEPTHLSHITSRLSSLVIKPISRSADSVNLFGWKLSAAERDDLARRIEAEPWRWCAQDPLAMSTAPVVTEDGLEPRNVVLRTFAVADDEDYVVMPGGLGRVSVRPDSSAVSSQTGAPSKDVWVLADARISESEQPEVHQPTLLPDQPGGFGAQGYAAPAPRVASDLYWLGRYAERAESAARLVRVADNLVDDHAGHPGSIGHSAMVAVLRAVTEVTRVLPGFTGEGGVTGEGIGTPDLDAAAARLADPLPHLRELVLDPRLVGSVAYGAHRAVLAAQAVREQLSSDTWMVLSRLERTLTHAQDDDDLQELLMESLEALLALAGIGVESLVRDPAWAFTDAGKRIERGQQTVRLLRHTLAVVRSPLVQGTTTEAALVATESVITYRRRLAAGLGPHLPLEAALDLLLRDPANPRSVRFQVDALVDALEVIGNDATRARVAALSETMEAYDIAEMVAGDRAGLVTALDALDAELRSVHEELAELYFVGKGTQRSVQWTAWTDGVLA